MVMAGTFSSALAIDGGFNPERLFFGAGLSRNEVGSFDDGTGFQLFAGYRFGEIAQNIHLDAEVGYMDTGDMKSGPLRTSAEGLWSTAVVRLIASPQLELLGRAGLDFGDDDGLMVGVGAGFNLNRHSQLRLEYVERDNVESLQANFVFRP